MGRKGEETKSMIRQVSLTLFSEKGFKDVTMKEICEATGLSRGGLYLHYDSTRSIFAEVIDDLLQYQDDEFIVQINQGQPAALVLEQVLERYQSEMTNPKGDLSLALYEYFNSMRSEIDLPLLGGYGQSLEMWKKLLDYGIGTKEFNEVDMKALHDALFFAYLAYQGVRLYSRLMPIDPSVTEYIVAPIKDLLLKNQ